MAASPTPRERFDGLLASRFLVLAAHNHLAEHDVFEHRLVRPQVKALKHHAEMFAQLVDVGAAARDFDAVDRDRALVGVFQCVDAAQHRGFARTRRAQNHHFFAAVHIKVDALENLQIAEMLVQPADADHDVFVAHLSSPLPRALFKHVDEPGQAERCHPVHQGNSEIGLPVARRGARDGACGVGEFGKADGRHQRGVLQNGDGVVAQGRQHAAESLRQDDVTHALPVGHAHGAGRFALALVERLNTGAEYFAHVGAGIERDRKRSRRGTHRSCCEFRVRGCPR